jgi:hypothetical protein
VRFETLSRDVQLAVHRLWNNPAFTTVAIVTLALGIGATTAIVTLVEQVMFRPLRVERPNQLWRIGDTLGCCNSTGYGQDNWTFFSWELIGAAPGIYLYTLAACDRTKRQQEKGRKGANSCCSPSPLLLVLLLVEMQRDGEGLGLISWFV